MNRIRVTSLAILVGLAFAPLPAAAQGPGSNLQQQVTNLQQQVAQLTTAVAALQSALANETTARQSVDTALQTSINSETTTRAGADTALDARVAKFEGNITAADLEGTYNLYMVATVLEDCCGANTIASYVVTGTMTFAAGGTGQVENTVAAGRLLTERLPGQTWLVSGASESGAFDGSFSWVYNNGVVTINAAGDINDFTPTAGGQVMLGVQGGSPGNNQIMFVLTRQPSI